MIDIPEIFQIFLDQSTNVAVLRYDQQGLIVSHNGCFSKLVAGGKSLIGTPVATYLMPEFRNWLPLPLAPGKSGDVSKVLFKDTNDLPVSLLCHFFVQGNNCLMLGEKQLPAAGDILLTMSRLTAELTNLTMDLQRKNRELEHANATIKTLRGIIPICSFCKGIRNDEGYWKKLEHFLQDQTYAIFSHGVCPDCMEKHYPENE